MYYNVYVVYIVWYFFANQLWEEGGVFMTEQEFKEAQQEANELAFLLIELKKRDPSISEKLSWFLQGLKIAESLNDVNCTS